MGSDFIFHSVSEKEREEIREQSKGIMNSFAKKLEAIDESKLGEPEIDRDFFERAEDSVKDCVIDREIMFENAPNKKGDFILGEKKTW